MGGRLALVVCLAAAACGDGATGVDPDTAPQATVDRFSDDAGTLQMRSMFPSLPAAGAAVDFDQPPFQTLGLGPDGQQVRYYNFDVQSRVPMVVYELVNESDRPIEGQLPIVSAIPGEAGYSDFWQLRRATVLPGYVANQYTSAAELAGLPVATEPQLYNRPIVPPGLTAVDRIGGGDPGLERAWRDGQVVWFFRFAEATIDPVAIGDFAGQMPISYIFVTFNVNPGEAGGGLPSGFETEPGTDQTHNALATIPSDADYSPLWMVNIYDNAFFDSVTDYDSATMATVLAAPDGGVNCPYKYIAP